ncbi:ADP-heptose:LPS heptosyltransferase [Candidatus Vecturithrix granuli]|uniref:ADP-heptose:LPS heptosyltransferase n=1 Tax=Vecturithrix granuli TaxID=1499967 RepID=A0A081BYG4_VECG1|nr:ADP-heptose:LPS heptosyltransferase [Candidatus Vecturithrix granuli]
MRSFGVHYMTGIKSAENILVIQLRQVGDVLLTTPAIKVLRDHYPHSRISFLTETGPAALLCGNPHLDAIITRKRRNTFLEDLKLARELRKAKYDLVIDFFCNPRSAWMSFLTDAPQRIATYHSGRSWWYTHTPEIKNGTCYAVEDKLALLRAVGISGELTPPVLMVSEDATHYIDEFFRQEHLLEQQAGPVITIDPTSRRQAKRWIPERYVELADRLVERYQAAVIFIWGPEEHDMVTSLVQQGQYPHKLACPTDLVQLAALIQKSDLHIGNCSAPRHIAVAVGTPSLTIMGPTAAVNWTYPSPLHKAVQGKVSCLECHKTECKTHDCMKALTVQEVEKAVEQLLGIIDN